MVLIFFRRVFDHVSTFFNIYLMPPSFGATSSRAVSGSRNAGIGNSTLEKVFLLAMCGWHGCSWCCLKTAGHFAVDLRCSKFCFGWCIAAVLPWSNEMRLCDLDWPGISFPTFSKASTSDSSCSWHCPHDFYCALAELGWIGMNWDEHSWDGCLFWYHLGSIWLHS